VRSKLESWQLSQLSLPHDPKEKKEKITKNEIPLSRVSPVQYKVTMSLN